MLSGGWQDWGERGARPIRVEGGLVARSERGAIGSTWWSRRFVAVLESLSMGGRLTRGAHVRPQGSGARADRAARRRQLDGPGLAPAALPGERGLRRPPAGGVGGGRERARVAGAVPGAAARRRAAGRARGAVHRRRRPAVPRQLPRADHALHLPRRGRAVQAHRRHVLPAGGAVRRRPVRAAALARKVAGRPAGRPRLGRAGRPRGRRRAGGRPPRAGGPAVRRRRSRPRPVLAPAGPPAGAARRPSTRRSTSSSASCPTRRRRWGAARTHEALATLYLALGRDDEAAQGGTG